MKKSLKVLNSKEGLGIFPEGTTKGLEKGVKVKNGAAFMALRTGNPIVPVGVEVTKKPFSKIIVRYGKTLDYSQHKFIVVFTSNNKTFFILYLFEMFFEYGHEKN